MQTNSLTVFGFTCFVAAICFASVVGCDSGKPFIYETSTTFASDSESDEGRAPADQVGPDTVTEGGSTDSGDSVDASASKMPPKQSATPDVPVEVISFDDLNIGMPVDARFRPQMLEYNDGRVKELLGKKVNVAGYMNPTDTLKGVTEFILLRNLECKFGPGGQADHLVHVLMDEGTTTEFTDKVIYVEGVMSLNPFPDDEPITWSIYDIKATKVSTKAPPRSR